jgi:hypothetical protein
MADANSFEFWQAGEQPDEPQNGLDSGSFEYWQAGEQPPVYAGADDVIIRTLPTTGAGR